MENAEGRERLLGMKTERVQGVGTWARTVQQRRGREHQNMRNERGKMNYTCKKNTKKRVWEA